MLPSISYGGDTLLRRANDDYVSKSSTVNDLRSKNKLLERYGSNFKVNENINYNNSIIIIK